MSSLKKLEDLIAELQVKISDNLIAEFEADISNRLLSGLEPREIEILKARFGVGSADEIAAAVHEQARAVSAERIRQINEGALRKLKYLSRTRNLRRCTDTPIDG